MVAYCPQVRKVGQTFFKKVDSSKRRSAPLYLLGPVRRQIPKLFFEGRSISPEAVTRITFDV